mmetsp:Transcript_35738/g.52439  ORF Transcript_35738/g.52439 Transcript_35738/m.52439 type:complete len:294 (-) Transcript_35738:152-1033(-)
MYQRLLLGIQVHHLCIAAALEIENPIIVPAMFVVTDEVAGRIGRESCLARARQTEEDCCVASGPHSRRAVHTHDALQRKQIIHQRKSSFLHLTRVLCSGDDLQPAVRIERNTCLGAQAFLLPLLKLGATVDDGEVWRKGFQLFLGRAHEHVCAEVVVPCELRHDAHGASRISACAHKAVKNVDLVKRLEALAVQQEDFVKGRFLDRQVDASPAHVVVRIAGIDDVAVLGAAAGELASVHEHRVVFDDLALTTGEHFVAHGIVIHVVLAAGQREKVGYLNIDNRRKGARLDVAF